MANNSAVNQQLLDDLEDDLLALIQEEGLTTSRLQTFGANIMELYGSTNAGYVRRAIQKQVSAMEDDQYTTALKSALRVFEGAALLTDRRAELMKVEGFEKSEDTLRRWERRGIKTLTRKLVEHAASLKSSGDAAQDYERYTQRSDDLAEQIDGLRARLEEDVSRRVLIERRFGAFAASMSFVLDAMSTASTESDSPVTYPLSTASLYAHTVADEFANDRDRSQYNARIREYYAGLGMPPVGLFDESDTPVASDV